MRLPLLAAAALLAAAPASAHDKQRDFCPDRPGLNTPPCTFDPGHGDIEIGLVDWTLERQPGSRTDTLVFGDTLVRYGLTTNLEMQLGWTAYGTVRQRDASGISRMSGTGDVTIALRRNLLHPDGSGVSVALMPYASLPTGGQAIGAGTWSTGMLVPASFDLGHNYQLGLTGRIEAAANASRSGRHLAYGIAMGLNLPVAPKLTAVPQLSVQRDLDPSGHSTPVVTALSFAYLANKALQLDVSANKGVSGGAPAWELSAGFAKRF
jgi:hypothetical protein